MMVLVNQIPVRGKYHVQSERIWRTDGFGVTEMLLIRRTLVTLTVWPLEGIRSAFVYIIVFVITPSSSGFSPAATAE